MLDFSRLDSDQPGFRPENVAVQKSVLGEEYLYCVAAEVSMCHKDFFTLRKCFKHLTSLIPFWTIREKSFYITDDLR